LNVHQQKFDIQNTFDEEDANNKDVLLDIENLLISEDNLLLQDGLLEDDSKLLSLSILNSDAAAQ
jgi:hypothetical protein